MDNVPMFFKCVKGEKNQRLAHITEYIANLPFEYNCNFNFILPNVNTDYIRQF